MLKKTITAEVKAKDIIVTDKEAELLKKKAELELAKIKKESQDDKKIEPKSSN